MKHELHLDNVTNRLSFLRGFVTNPSMVGSVIPSSRFLERRLVQTGSVDKARLVVELGPGTGGTTKAILKSLPNRSTLLAIELNPDFATLAKGICDSRLIVHHGNAEHISKTLRHYGLKKPDLIISGIPFSTMPFATGHTILKEIWSCLRVGGKFVAYQFRDSVASIGQDFLGSPQTKIEFLNVPPVRVYSWQKKRI